MAELSKRNVFEMVNAVDGLIDQESTDSTTPSISQVVSWINEGVLEVFRFAPPSSLKEVMVSDTFYGSSVTSNELSDNVLRVVSVKRNDVECKKLTLIQFSEAKTILKMKYTSNSPAYSYDVNGGYPRFRFVPSVNAYISIEYIPLPFVYELPANGEEAETPSGKSVPISLEKMVIDYAAMRYRTQDEEPAQFKLYLEQWMQRLQMEHGVPGDNLEATS